MSMARSRAALRSSFMWVRMLSVSWFSIVKTGFRLVIGSWKIIEIWFPRMLRISSWDSLSRFCPR